MQGPWPASGPPITSGPPSGFFAGANNVNASHGVFTDIAGDLNIVNVEIKV
jgi:hypothetical protein